LNDVQRLGGGLVLTEIAQLLITAIASAVASSLCYFGFANSYAMVCIGINYFFLFIYNNIQEV
jgi:hypothetical protein